jgi:polar amino acid transport system substrate-binding protein
MSPLPRILHHRLPPTDRRTRGRSAWRWVVGLAIGCLVLSAPVPAKAPKATVSPPVNPLIRLSDNRLLAPDIARIVQRGELVVAMAGMDTPPFFYQRGGKLLGLEVEMADDLARELKVKVRFNRSAHSFNEVVDIVARQEADVGISKLSRTLARAQTVRFSEPYLRLKHALALNRLALAKMTKDRSVQSLVRNFDGTLGVIASSSFADFAMHNFPKADIRTYPGWQDVVQAVRDGEVVAAYRDEFEIKRLLRGDATASLTLRTVTLTDLEDTLGIAVGVGDPVLLDVVNLFLAQRPEKLDIDRILQAVEH